LAAVGVGGGRGGRGGCGGGHCVGWWGRGGLCVGERERKDVRPLGSLLRRDEATTTTTTTPLTTTTTTTGRRRRRRRGDLAVSQAPAGRARAGRGRAAGPGLDAAPLEVGPRGLNAERRREKLTASLPSLFALSLSPSFLLLSLSLTRRCTGARGSRRRARVAAWARASWLAASWSASAGAASRRKDEGGGVERSRTRCRSVCLARACLVLRGESGVRVWWAFAVSVVKSVWLRGERGARARVVYRVLERASGESRREKSSRPPRPRPSRTHSLSTQHNPIPNSARPHSKPRAASNTNARAPQHTRGTTKERQLCFPLTPAFRSSCSVRLRAPSSQPHPRARGQPESTRRVPRVERQSARAQML